jgi:heme/copper-type cytochrome/quinol oxidase subunit 4
MNSYRDEKNSINNLSVIFDIVVIIICIVGIIFALIN